MPLLLEQGSACTPIIIRDAGKASHFVFPGTLADSPRAKHSLDALCIFIYVHMEVPHLLPETPYNLIESNPCARR